MANIPNIPNEPVVDANGNVSVAWRKYFNELARLLQQALEP